MGGHFSTLGGQPRANLGRLQADGTTDHGFNPGADDGVWSLVLQADGRILVGGEFTKLGGQPRNCLARLNADGTVDSRFSPGPGGYVSSLALQTDGRILVGGGFGTLDGQPRNYLGRLGITEPAIQSLEDDGTFVTWWRSGASPEVWRTTFDYSTNGNLWTPLGFGSRTPGLAAGQSGGWRLARVSLPANATLRARGHVTGGSHNASAWFVETYSGRPGFSFQPLSRTNQAGTAASFRVVAGGTEPLSFQWRKDGVPLVDAGNPGWAAAAELVLANVLGSDAGAYSVVVSNPLGYATSMLARLTVRDPVIALQPGDQCGQAGQSVEFNVAVVATAPVHYRWQKDGVPLSQGTGPSLSLSNLQAGDAGLYRVLVLNRYGCVTSAVAELTVNLITLDGGFDPGPSGSVSSLAVQANGQILLGGSFSNLAGQARTNLARLQANGGLDGTFNPGAQGGYYVPVKSLIVQPDGRILVGGEFSTLAGQPRALLGRLNGDGTIESGFNLGARCTDGSVPSVSLASQPDGKILLGGSFTSVGGQTRKYLARLNADGTLDSTFNPGADSAVHSLAAQADGRILVGGGFTTLGAQARACLARLNADGTVDSGFNPQVGGYFPVVSSLIVQADGKILVGGRFDTVGGQPRTNMARLNVDGTLDWAFMPAANSNVVSLAVQADGKILVGGQFTTLGGQPRTNLARLNRDGTVDREFIVGANGRVLALAVQADGRILVGGSFTTLGGQPRTYLGRLNNTVPPLASLTYDGAAITWQRGGSAPEVWWTTFEAATNGGLTWFHLGPGTRIPGGWQLVGVSVPAGASVRARGLVVGGCHSDWFIETALPFSSLLRPSVPLGDGAFGVVSNRFGFHVRCLAGKVVTVEASTNLAQWIPVFTNTVGEGGQFYFSEGVWSTTPARFYRARLWP